MARWRHYVRKGDAAFDQRDLQVNGRARPSEAFDLAGGEFYKVPPGYQGFAADGIWYENAIEVSAGLSESFGASAHPLNTLKWRFDSTMAAVQGPDGLVVLATEAEQKLSLVARRWQLRGDFQVRLRVHNCAIAEGADTSPLADNAVWLAVTRLTNEDVFLRVKRWRGKNPEDDGVAAEVFGDAFVGALVRQGLEDFDLVIARDDGAITGTVVEHETGVEHTVYGPVAFPGILFLSAGARCTKNEPWGFELSKLLHDHGWHNYSHRASWWREGRDGTFRDDFVGDELDPELWTTSTSGGGTHTVEDGLALSVDGPGSVAARTPAITGDFSLLLDVRVPDTNANAGAASNATDAIFQARLWTAATRPSTTVGLYLDDEGQPVARARHRAKDADPWTTLAEQPAALPAGTSSWRIALHRRGLLVQLLVLDQTGAVVLDAEDDTLHTLPVHAYLEVVAETEGAVLDATVRTAHLSSPHALDGDAWPLRSYAASLFAAVSEVRAADGEAPALSDVTIIDIAERRPAWRAVGSGLGPTAFPTVEGRAALMWGAPWDPWFDPDLGRLWVPVRAQGPLGTPSFIGIDLRRDQVWRKRPASEAGFGFDAPVAYRHLGLGYTPLAVPLHGLGDIGRPPNARPIRYQRWREGSHEWHAWATEGGVRLRRFDQVEWDEVIILAPLAHEDESIAVTCTVQQVVVLPGGADHASQLVASAIIHGDYAVAVYRDLADLLGGAATLYGADSADAVYTGTGAAARWDEPPRERLLGAAIDEGGQDIDARVPLSQADGDRFPLIAVPRRWGLSLIQDGWIQADVRATHWETVEAGAPGVAPAVLAAQPRSARLTSDADIAPGRGFLAVQEWGSGNALLQGDPPPEPTIARVEVLSLARQNVRYSLAPEDIDGEEFPEQIPNGEMIRLIESPPDAAAGVRLVIGYHVPQGAVVEWDLWTVGAGTFRGPHIGGTKVTLTGWGLENTREVRVGGVPCFRLRRQEDPAGGPATLSAVNRALAYIEHSEAKSPVMPDEELEATAEWPHDLEVVANDGGVLLLPDGFVYESNLCIERTTRRLLARLPTDQVLDRDPKVDKLQRHIMIALALLICRYRNGFQVKVARDTFRAEAKGDGLFAYAASAGAGPPLPTMSEEQIRAYVLARAFGGGPTTKRVLDVAESILGVRPTIVEGYREFTIEVDEGDLPGTLPTNDFWGDDADDDPLDSHSFMDRDFWAGEDPRIGALRSALDFVRATGVAARVTVAPAA